MTGCNSSFAVNLKGKVIIIKSNDESYSLPPDIGFSFTMCHSPLSQEADGFQLLVDSESSRHFMDQELIRGVELKTLEYTRIKSPMEVRAAGDNVLRGTAQGILLVVVRVTDDVLRTVKLPIVLVPGRKRKIFSTSAAAQKGVKTII